MSRFNTTHHLDLPDPPSPRFTPAIFVIAAILTLVVPLAALAIDCGETLNGQLTPIGPDTHTFEARVGEAVAITIWRSAGSPTHPVINVTEPNNNLLAFTNLSGNIAGTTCGLGVCVCDALTLNGTYTVEVVEFDALHTGGYDISLESTTGKLNNATCASSFPIACGETVFLDEEANPTQTEPKIKVDAGSANQEGSRRQKTSWRFSRPVRVRIRNPRRSPANNRNLEHIVKPGTACIHRTRIRRARHRGHNPDYLRSDQLYKGRCHRSRPGCR